MSETVKSCVSLQQLNIFDNAIQKLGKFDYVLSRNMLIYFDLPTREKASKIFHSLLRKPDTTVICGHAGIY